MCKKKILIGFFALIFLAVAIFFIMPERIVTVFGSIGKVVIVVDPGHGGIDGGAQTKGGVCEKEINLHIGMRIKELAEKEGWYVVMTRENDEGLYDEGKGSIRSKKNQDLTKRQKIINGSGADAAVSIHLNSYPSQSAKGAQTFYSKKSEEGKIIAEKIQNCIKEKLDSENERTSLPKDDIIIMKDNVCPLVLVECGFLSNEEEAKKLQQEDYQDKIAEIVVDCLKEHFIERGKIKKEEIPVVVSEK